MTLRLRTSFLALSRWLWLAGLVVLLLAGLTPAWAATEAGPAAGAFPPPLSSYHAPAGTPLLEVLLKRIQAEPLNLAATVIFLLAIIHTFLAPAIMRRAHHLEQRHQERLARAGRLPPPDGGRGEVSFAAEILHFLGEVEAIFGIWAVPLLAAITYFQGWPTARDYLAHGVNFAEPLFVVIIMTMASSRPILKLAEQLMARMAALGKSSPAAWWLSILTLGPVLGSFITEPAAITISALLLAGKFYQLGPSPRFAYATLGLLFVNVSVGGTLTHFAAPPVLMVASKWGWGLLHMATYFGWKAVAGIVTANLLYLIWFWREFKKPGMIQAANEPRPAPAESIPIWVTAVHILFLVWTVANNHYPALFIGGFLFYLAFLQATEHYQSELSLRPALMVGFFLAGLVIHGRLQGWWLAPVLSHLNQLALFFGAMGLTAFNDNAAITYLASQVPGFSAQMKYAVVSGAVVGGGLTVIANAPNPAGQSILTKFFPDGISPLGLLLGALLPTAIMAAAFLFL